MGKRPAGEGSIYYKEEKELWVAQVTLPTGKRKTKYGKTQKEVKAWLQTQREAVSKGVYVENDQVTLSAFLDQYMVSAANNLRPKTVDSYNYLIKNHIVPNLGKIRLSQLRPDHLQAFYNQKINEGLSKRTVQYMHAVLHKALEQAMRFGLVIRNVSDLVDPPAPKKTTPVIFTVEQTKKFLELVRGHRWEMIYLIAIGGGLREGEILALSPTDISIERKVVYVTKALQYLPKRGLVLTEPKTESGKRMIPLPAFVLVPLEIYLDSLKDNQKFLFETGNSTPISPRNLLRHYHSVLKQMGLPIMPFHNLRHLSASLALLAGVNPKTVQSRLGHSTISLTLNTYSHLLPGVEEEAAEKMNKILS
jgi:integrase